MRKSSGVLLICENTGNFLLLKRSKISYFPYSWSLTQNILDLNILRPNMT